MNKIKDTLMVVFMVLASLLIVAIGHILSIDETELEAVND